MNLKVLCFLLMGSAAQAALVRDLNEMQVIEMGISRQGLTRITVKEDRIQNVFGNSGEYVLEADEAQGQVFIRPIGSGVTKPFSLTLTTEGGHTQDLRLIPQDKVPEPLILKKGETVSDSHKKKPPSITREDLEELLNGLRKETIPLGYKPVPIELKARELQVQEFKIPNGHLVLIRELKGEKLRGLTFEVKNSSKTLLNLSEAGFAKNHEDIAVLLLKRTLKPGERTYAYVVSRIRP